MGNSYHAGTETAALAEHIRSMTVASIKPQRLDDGRNVILVPEGYTAEYSDAPDNHKLPPFVSASPIFHEVEGFIGYTNDFKVGATRILADLSGLSLTALLDYHAKDAPAHVAHRATLQLATTASWKAWNSINNRALTQLEFAEFIEQFADDIMAPAAADLLEMVENFKENRTVTFQSKVNRANGTVRLQYADEEDPKATGQVKMPETLSLSFGVFEGQDISQIKAFVRTRVDHGKLSIRVQLHKIEDVRREAFDRATSLVEVGTNIKIAAGTLGRGY